ncbi:unnamed protein product [Arctogadus glacialis]
MSERQAFGSQPLPMLVFVSRLQTCSDTLTTAPQPPAVLFCFPQRQDSKRIKLGDPHPPSKTLGVPLSQAMVEYEQGDYSRAVELLQPLRYGRMETGGLD